MSAARSCDDATPDEIRDAEIQSLREGLQHLNNQVCDVYVQRGHPSGKGGSKYVLHAKDVPAAEAFRQVHLLRVEAGIRWAYCTEPRDV